MKRNRRPSPVRKFLYGWKLYVNYGQGWEYEQFEDTREGYLVNRREYLQNCPYPQKWTRGREINPEWEILADMGAAA